MKLCTVFRSMGVLRKIFALVPEKMARVGNCVYLEFYPNEPLEMWTICEINNKDAEVVDFESLAVAIREA